jgi:hypothetical protein
MGWGSSCRHAELKGNSIIHPLDILLLSYSHLPVYP